MKTTDLLARQIPSKIIAEILGVTPRQVRKMRQGSILALSRVDEEIQLRDEVENQINDAEQQWIQHLDECRLRDGVYAARRKLRLLNEQVDEAFEEGTPEVMQAIVKQVDDAEKAYFDAKTRAWEAGVYVNDYGKLQEHLARQKARRHTSKKANKKAVENPMLSVA